MSDHDPKLEALFKAAVKGQEKLERVPDDEDGAGAEQQIEIEEEDADAGADGDDGEVVVSSGDSDAGVEEAEASLSVEPPPEAAARQPAPPPAAAAAPADQASSQGDEDKAKKAKRMQDALTEALIKAKQEALQALEQTQKEAKSMRDRLLRVSADFDNFKKRARKQQDEAIKFANESMLRELLPVLDNFDRALEHVDSEDKNPVVQGIQMVHGHLIATFEKVGLKKFSAVGEAFDPNLHEAVEQKQTDESPAGQVVSEYQKGYLLQNRLLRPAMVVVAMPLTPPPQAEADGGAAGAEASTGAVSDGGGDAGVEAAGPPAETPADVADVEAEAPSGEDEGT